MGVELTIYATILLVAIGAFLLPMSHFKDLRLQNYLNLATLLALTTALCTTGYSLIDDQALRTIRQMPGIPLNSISISILYSLIEAWSCSLCLFIFISINKIDFHVYRPGSGEHRLNFPFKTDL